MSENIIIDCVTSGDEALKMLENSDYSCIISDYQMPEMNGLELLKILRVGNYLLF